MKKNILILVMLLSALSIQAQESESSQENSPMESTESMSPKEFKDLQEENSVSITAEDQEPTDSESY